MAIIKKLFSEKEWTKGECDCGGTSFEFWMSHTDPDRIALIYCINCGATVPPMRDDEIDIECDVDC